MGFKRLKQQIVWMFISCLLLSLTACDLFSDTTNLETIQKRRAIIMGTINSSLTYSYDGSDYSGFDYELGKKFAAYLNVDLRVKEYDNLNELFTALENDKIDFIGSGLTLTPKRAQKYRSSPPYYYVSQKVVYHKGTFRPRNVTEIKGPIGVLEGSSHEEVLENLIDEVPTLRINALASEDQESLLQKVANKEIKFAIVDSSTLAQKQRYYPVLAEAFTIAEKQPVAWLIKRNQDDTVYSAMIEFIGNQYQEQSITKLEEKYFGHVEHFDFVDTRIFLKRIKKTLPKYQSLFQKYSTPEVDWSLLAAVSYQESHWNPKAKSPTGVRGMMMLTLDTADYLGVENRLDPRQSIKGGATYLSQLIKRLPDSISDGEKVWFALASYNLGYGHLMDARRITAMKKQNPNLWSDVKDNLPLLHQKKWYKKTRYGYARGREAQLYVNNIRQYRKTLTWFIDTKEKALARKKALQKALAEQSPLQSPLDKKKSQQQIQKELLAKEDALRQAKQKTLEIEKSLQKAKEKSRTMAQALQKATLKSLAEEKRQQQAKTKNAKQLQALQQDQNKALAELRSYQQEKNKALAEQENLQQAKDNVLTALEKVKRS